MLSLCCDRSENGTGVVRRAADGMGRVLRSVAQRWDRVSTGLSGILLGLVAAPAAGVLFMIGGFAWLALALFIGAMALIVPANYERVQAIKRYRTDWYP